MQDLLVADLGEFPPSITTTARDLAAWVANGKFGAMWLDGWPRVADVEAADFNDDGKADLVVAAFGCHETGNISVLENNTTDYAQPQFATHSSIRATAAFT